MKLIGYVRVSTDIQAEEGISLDAQEAEIQRYCQLYHQRYELVRVVRDPGWSGRSLDRPGVQEALVAIENGEVDGLIVSKLDRLSRSVRDLVAITERDIPLLSVQEQIDTSSPTGRLIFHMMGAMAQWERETIAERIKRALAHLKAQGVRLGEVPYGLRLTQHRDQYGRLIAVEDEDETKVIELIMGLRTGESPMSYRRIAEYLNKEEIPSKKGQQWYSHGVYRIATRIDPDLKGTRATRFVDNSSKEEPSHAIESH